MGLFKELVQHATAEGSRSTALKSIFGMAIVLLAGVLACLYADAPVWMLYLVSGLFGLNVVSFLAAYFILLWKDPEIRWSE